MVQINPKYQKNFDIVGKLAVVILCLGVVIYYLTGYLLIAYLGVSILICSVIVYWGFYIPAYIKEYNLEKKHQEGFEKLWSQTNLIFFVSFVLFMTLFSIGLPIALLFKNSVLAISALLIFFGSIIYAIIMTLYFLLRKRSIISKDFESAKSIILPLIIILGLSALSRTYVEDSTLIGASTLAVVIILALYLWKKNKAKK